MKLIKIYYLKTRYNFISKTFIVKQRSESDLKLILLNTIHKQVKKLINPLTTPIISEGPFI